MSESNTAKRIAFFQMLCKLGDYAWIKNIRILPMTYSPTAVQIFIVDIDDEIIIDDPNYEVLGRFWESIGGTWRGREKDRFEY